MPILVNLFEEISIVKHPGAVLDYQFDWSEWLGTDTIVTSTWTVPDGITKESDSHTASITTVKLSGGTEFVAYRTINTITTASRTEKAALTINVSSKGGA